MATFIPVSSSGIKPRGGYNRESSHQSVSVWGFEGEKPPRISIRDLTPHLPNTVCSLVKCLLLHVLVWYK